LRCYGEEFIAAILSMTKMTSTDNIARAFAYFDVDGRVVALFSLHTTLFCSSSGQNTS
jgi:hypothetical protein